MVLFLSSADNTDMRNLSQGTCVGDPTDKSVSSSAMGSAIQATYGYGVATTSLVRTGGCGHTS